MDEKIPDGSEEMRVDLDLDFDIDFNLDFYFSFTRSAWILTTASASISFLFSTLVIAFILRSQQHARYTISAYHRIMLFMSSWDVISSLAIALTTLPMPQDVRDVYPFDGRSFGNVATCTCQGFLIIVGSLYTIWSNCTLNIYYVCTIKYGMSEDIIIRRLLPLMLCISTLYVGVFGYLLLSLDLINPQPFEPFCLAGSYPYNCEQESAVTSACIRGYISERTVESLVIIVSVTGFLAFFCIVTSMALVVLAVFGTEKTHREQRQQQQHDADTPTRTRRRSSNDDFRNTRTALRQALMYIAAFSVTWMWMGLFLVMGWSVELGRFLDPIKLLCQPLQGFFNGVIFISHKASILRKANPRLTRCQALRQVILSPSTVPEVLVSQIGAVGDDEDEEGNVNVDMDFDVRHRDIVDANHNNGNSHNRSSHEGGRSLPRSVLSSIPSSTHTPSLDFSRALLSNSNEPSQMGVGYSSKTGVGGGGGSGGDGDGDGDGGDGDDDCNDNIATKQIQVQSEKKGNDNDNDHDDNDNASRRSSTARNFEKDIQSALAAAGSEKKAQPQQTKAMVSHGGGVVGDGSNSSLEMHSEESSISYNSQHGWKVKFQRSGRLRSVSMQQSNQNQGGP